MFNVIIQLMLFLSIILAVCSFWTGISVGANRHMMTLRQRAGVFASIAASFGYVFLIIIWWSEQGWQYLTAFESFAWMTNHIVAFFAFNVYHSEVLKNLGFITFRESRENAARVCRRFCLATHGI